jgi:hypothetical protein
VKRKSPDELVDRDRARSDTPPLLPVFVVPWWHRFVPCSWTPWERYSKWRMPDPDHQQRHCVVCGKGLDKRIKGT